MLFIQLIHPRFRILFSMVKIGFEIKHLFILNLFIVDNKNNIIDICKWN